MGKKAALAAGSLALRYREQGVTWEDKPDSSPVTIADRECEAEIIRTILAEFPEDGLLGEEGSNRDSLNGRRWIIDPIDGTRDFVRRSDFWSHLIGLEVEGEVVAGIAYLPALDQMFFAERGCGAYRDDARIRVSTVRSADRAVICFNALNTAALRPYADRILPWMSRFWATRSFGGCLDAMMVAEGQADLYVEPSAKAWDAAPLKIIIEEAGGLFFNFDGRSSIYGGDCICCTPGLGAEARRFLDLG